MSNTDLQLKYKPYLPSIFGLLSIVIVICSFITVGYLGDLMDLGDDFNVFAETNIFRIDEYIRCLKSGHHDHILMSSVIALTTILYMIMGSSLAAFLKKDDSIERNELTSKLSEIKKQLDEIDSTLKSQNNTTLCVFLKSKNNDKD